MESKYLGVLEYPKVLARLAEHTSFSAGRELALSLDASSNLEEARRRQQETTEACRLLDAKSDVTLGGAHDVRPLLERAQRGSRLLPTELLDIESTLLAGQPLRRTLSRLGAHYPLLATMAARIEECGHVVAEIKRCITPKGEVADSASPELGRIRSQLGIARDRLMQRLERLIMNPDSGGLLQEPIITQRGGRYVIPLRAECKGRIPGLVHDESASGATVFIEPLATVELNNELREWQLREEREVMRILDGLTALVGAEGHLIQRTVDTLAEFDLIFARARYSYALKATEPTLLEFAPALVLDERQGISHPGTHLRLLQARHPLLPHDVVVPIDAYLRLGPRGYFVVLITGPNTGGKTVALKTVGLLCLMAQAGLRIPAAEGSVLCVFDGIYADIGDEQSIEQSLSTFSSHMTNIIHILSQANERSLVLLDELGAGTDPVEGSVLGRSLLTELVVRGVTTVATTHHPELKIFAQVTPGIENASVEFDTQTLAPTYSLSIGMPGRSNALAIAERLGLDRSIVERARSLVDPQLLQTDELLLQAKLLKDQAEGQLQQAQERRQQVERHEAELAEQVAELRATREEALEGARREARGEVEELRQEIAQARSQLAKVRVAAQAGQVREALASVEAARERAVVRLASDPLNPLRGAEEPEVGDVVWVKTLQAQGVVTAVDEGQAAVSVGNLRLRVVLEELEVREPAAKPVAGIMPRRDDVRVPTAVGKSELHLRGLRVEEAMPELSRYLDQSYLAGLPRVRIVHGKGTGALRRIVREELSRHPLVAAIHKAQEYEGGEGVTIAELVPRHA